MSVRTMVLAGCATMLAGGAVAQPFDGSGDCERHATAFYKAADPEFKSFVINRSTVEEVGFDDDVGSQHVTAIFRGRATYTGVSRKITATFICLHAGPGKGAVFVYLFPR